jgi:glutathionyl-hydroquinone reductase
VSLGCPWANRTVTVRALKGLEGVVGLSIVDPLRDVKGWAFREAPGATGDPINGFEYLSEAYEGSLPGYDDRYGVPVLWDRNTGQIVNNESSEIIVMLNGAFNEWASHPELDLYPAQQRTEIDAINEWVYGGLNNGVYRVASHPRRRLMTTRSVRCLRRSTGWMRSSASVATWRARSTRSPTGAPFPR